MNNKLILYKDKNMVVAKIAITTQHRAISL